MVDRMIGTTLAAAGLVLALSGSRGTPGAEPKELAPADTVSADWLAQVTMEPIRVVVSREDRMEAVTMETIRVVIPREDEQQSPEP